MASVVVLGSTGNGKSTFANRLLGVKPSQLFKESKNLDSETQETLSKTQYWFSNSSLPQVEVTDTPGLADSQSLDAKHIQNMVAKIKTKKVNVFAVILNFQQDRFDGNIQRVLRLLREVFNSEKFWDHLVIIYTKCYRIIDGTESDIAEKRKQIGGKLRKVFDEIKTDPPVFFVDSHDHKDVANTGEFVAFFTLTQNKPQFNCSGMKFVDPSPNVHVHEWIPVHGNAVNQTDIRVERHHTGNWGGFANGWSCCGQGRGNFSWSHNDCIPRNIQTNRFLCTQCGRDPSSSPCSLRCSCGILKQRS